MIAANDEFFAPKEALVLSRAPEWREGAYTERGKWMDGWETRRRRTPGHDWAVLRLGVPGVVRGVVIDTSYFTGNYPERASLDGCALEQHPSAEECAGDGIAWSPLLPEVQLQGGTRNLFEVAGDRRVTHVRLNIFPDGGVARLRVHGEPRPDPRVLRSGAPLDLAAMELGGYVLVCSDMYFGHRQNLILPGRSTHMGDGWETKRRRGPGNDWTIVRLAARGTIEHVEIDTDHFKGNAPDCCMIECCDAPGASAAELESARWSELLCRSKLQPHTRHRFDALSSYGPATHVRLNIYPDGGVARLRVIGRISEGA